MLREVRCVVSVPSTPHDQNIIYISRIKDEIPPLYFRKESDLNCGSISDDEGNADMDRLNRKLRFAQRKGGASNACCETF